MIVDGVCCLVLAWVLANALQFMGAQGFVPGVRTCFFLWLGFIATTLISTGMYEGKKPALMVITTSYWFVSMLAMGAVIGLMT